MSHPLGLYSSGMHDFILRECEIGTRATHAEDDERCGFGPLFDLHYQMYVDAERAREAQQ